MDDAAPREQAADHDDDHEHHHRWWPLAPELQSNLGTVLAVLGVVLAWTAAVFAPQGGAGAGWRPVAIASWSQACPRCGIVESIITLQASGASGAAADAPPPRYRVTIRMADGSVRELQRAVQLAPGARVLVDGDSVCPAPPEDAHS